MNSVELVAISETIVKGNKIRFTDPKKVYSTKGLFSLYTWLIRWRRQTRMTLCLLGNYALYFLRIYLLTHIHFRDFAEAYMKSRSTTHDGAWVALIYGRKAQIRLAAQQTWRLSIRIFVPIAQLEETDQLVRVIPHPG